jgi:hypothetical protein
MTGAFTVIGDEQVHPGQEQGLSERPNLADAKVYHRPKGGGGRDAVSPEGVQVGGEGLGASNPCLAEDRLSAPLLELQVELLFPPHLRPLALSGETEVDYWVGT